MLRVVAFKDLLVWGRPSYVRSSLKCARFACLSHFASPKTTEFSRIQMSATICQLNNQILRSRIFFDECYFPLQANIFLSSVVLLIFEHYTQPATTAIELCYTTARQDSLTLFLENETNIPEMVWMRHVIFSIFCAPQMQLLLKRFGSFSHLETTEKPAPTMWTVSIPREHINSIYCSRSWKSEWTVRVPFICSRGIDTAHIVGAGFFLVRNISSLVAVAFQFFSFVFIRIWWFLSLLTGSFRNVTLDR